MRLHIPQTAPMRQIFLFLAPTVMLLLALACNAAGHPSQQFSYLAQSFTHGHLYFMHSIGGIGQDPVLYKGHEYWSEGVFPAIILIPFVALFSIFHAFFYQGYIDWVFILGTLYFVYAIARKLKYTVEDSLILMFGYGLGSAYIGIAIVSSGWVYAQVVTAFLLFWSLYEYFGKRRWWLIGTICAFLFLSRATAAPIALFFVLEIWQRRTGKPRLVKLLPIVLPLVAAVGLQCLYNFLRFHSPLNGGYRYQLLSPDSAESRALGVFSLRHIPANLFSLVLGNPIPVTKTSTSWTLRFPYITSNSYGISMFVTSPYFLYLFGRKWSTFSKTARNLMVSVAVSCFAILCFYGIGRNQLGYRYSLDFLPELFVILLLAYRVDHKRLSRGMKFLLLAACVFDFYLALTFIF